MAHRYIKGQAFRKKRHNYNALFTDAEKAKYAYNNDVKFRHFVNTWNLESADTLSMTYEDFYRAYKVGGVQLALNF